MKKSLFLLPLAALMLAGCGEQPTPPPTHEHTLSGWVSDASNHWKTCSECNAVVDKAAHVDGNSDGKCDTCNYQMSTHTHSWSDWKSDADKHWKECSCGQKSSIGAHEDGDKDGYCDACNYKLPEPDPVDGNITLDFVNKSSDYKSAFPFVKADTGVFEVTLEGMKFNALGCFTGAYNNVGYLMMKNKDMSGDCAFIASAVPTSKSIVSVELVTGSNASSKSAYSVVIDNKPISSASGTVTKTGSGAGTKITATASAGQNLTYFAVYTTDVSVNGQIATLKVTVE